METQCGCCEQRFVYDEAMQPRPLHHVHILRKTAADGDIRTYVELCSSCHSKMPFNVSNMVAHANLFKDTATASDTLLTDLLSQYIRDVWPEDNAPTIYELCDMLNKIGLRTTKGETWKYHNLAQKMKAIGVDRDKIIRTRATLPYAHRVQELLGYAREQLATEYRDRAKSPQSSGFEPPLPMPDDMPGMVRKT